MRRCAVVCSGINKCNAHNFIYVAMRDVRVRCNRSKCKMKIESKIYGIKCNGICVGSAEAPGCKCWLAGWLASMQHVYEPLQMRLKISLRRSRAPRTLNTKLMQKSYERRRMSTTTTRHKTCPTHVIVYYLFMIIN